MQVNKSRITSNHVILDFARNRDFFPRNFPLYGILLYDLFIRSNSYCSHSNKEYNGVLFSHLYRACVTLLSSIAHLQIVLFLLQGQCKWRECKVQWEQCNNCCS